MNTKKLEKRFDELEAELKEEYVKIIKDAQSLYGNKSLEKRLNKSNKYFYIVLKRGKINTLRKTALEIESLKD